MRSVSSRRERVTYSVLAITPAGHPATASEVRLFNRSSLDCAARRALAWRRRAKTKTPLVSPVQALMHTEVPIAAPLPEESASGG